jgi:lysophospholipase L1-like esterase
MYRLNFPTRVVAVASLALVASCDSSKREVLGPSTPKGGEIFKSYVAIGNSITAGYQSGGINDSTQRQSYARLLAQAMGTQYHYASLNMPGCVAPIANTQTGARVSGASSSACALRATASATDVLNNVAVPGARVLDPPRATTVASNALTTFVLGGKTQVQRALDARPTFVSIWIGNNDVLEAGLSGFLTPVAGVSPGIVSTQTAFTASYDLMIKQLLDSMPNLKGVLIGVVQVSGVGQLSSGGLIASSAAIQAGISQAAGTPVTVHPNCAGSTSLVNVIQLIPAIRRFVANPADPTAHPPLISCAAGVVPGTPVGDIFILSAAEQTTLSAAITAFNDYIKAKAAAIGFAYYDPNVLLAAKKASGEILPFPNLASTNATFGAFLSLDGVHPSGAAHVLLANELMAAINAKYGTTLAP